MLLRSGKNYKFFKKENQSFKLVVPKENVPSKQYEVKIDFDSASKEWRKNKKYIGTGQFKYH